MNMEFEPRKKKSYLFLLYVMKNDSIDAKKTINVDKYVRLILQDDFIASLLFTPLLYHFKKNVKGKLFIFRNKALTKIGKVDAIEYLKIMEFLLFRFLVCGNLNRHADENKRCTSIRNKRNGNTATFLPCYDEIQPSGRSKKER